MKFLLLIELLSFIKFQFLNGAVLKKNNQPINQWTLSDWKNSIYVLMSCTSWEIYDILIHSIGLTPILQWSPMKSFSNANCSNLCHIEFLTIFLTILNSWPYWIRVTTMSAWPCVYIWENHIFGNCFTNSLLHRPHMN